jgi:hypothetical protein
MSDVGKGTFSIKKFGDTTYYGADEIEVVKKLDEGWKTVNISTNGYSLSLEKANELTITAYRGTLNQIKAVAYVNKVEENRDGKNIDYKYECYGKEAFINYYTHIPTSNNVNTTLLLSDMMSIMGYPSPVCTSLPSSITLTGTGKRYIKEILDDITTTYGSLHYYFDNGSTLHMFKGNEGSYNLDIQNITNRDKVIDITNVYNKVTLTTYVRMVYDSYDYFTEGTAQLSNWKYKASGPGGIIILYSNEQNPDLHLLHNKGEYSVRCSGLTITNTDGIFSKEIYAQLDLVQPYTPDTVNGFHAVFRMDGTISQVDTLPVVYDIDMALQVNDLNHDYPPWQNGQICRRIHVGSYTINSGIWNTLDVNLREFSNNPTEFRYVGFYALVHTNNNVIQSGNVGLFIDEFQINTTYGITYVNTISSGLYGLREKIPDNSVYNARTSLDLYTIAQNYIDPMAVPEESIHSLVYAGSLELNPGYLITVAFDDFTKTYTIEEVHDKFTNGQWIQEIALSSSPIFMPKSFLGNKISKMDMNIREAKMELNNLDAPQTSVTNTVTTNGNFDWISVNNAIVDMLDIHGMEQLNLGFSSLTWASLEPILWHFNGANWDANTYNMPTPESYIRFHDTITNSYMDIFPFWSSSTDTVSPILYISQHLMVKKDITMGGMMASNQGALWLGGGFQGIDDQPQIILGHGGQYTISGTVYNMGTIYGTSPSMNTLCIYDAGGRYGNLANIKCNTVYANTLSHTDGTPYTFSSSFNGGTITGDISIFKSGAAIYLNSVSFYNSTVDIIRTGNNLIVEKDLWTNSLAVDDYIVAPTISVNNLTIPTGTGLTICTNIIPRLDATYDNGFAGNKWNRIYALTIETGHLWANTILNGTGVNGTVSLPGKISVGTITATSYENLPAGGSFSGNISDLVINTDKNWNGKGISAIGTISGVGVSLSSFVYTNGLNAESAGIATSLTVQGSINTNNILPYSGNTITYTRLRGGTIYASTYENLPAGGSFSGNLSDLSINDNKNWNGKNITNVNLISCNSIDDVSGEIYSYSNINPITNNFYGLGDGSHKWLGVFSTIWIDRLMVANDGSGSIDDSWIPYTDGDIYLSFKNFLIARSGYPGNNVLAIDKYGNFTVMGTIKLYNNMVPATNSAYHLGNNSMYWQGVWSDYLRYHSGNSAFDEYDDLSIAALWGEKTIKLSETYDKTKIKPSTNDPFSIIKGTDSEDNTTEFFDMGKTQSFIMGCLKQTKKEIDEQKRINMELLSRIENAENKLSKINN